MKKKSKGLALSGVARPFKDKQGKDHTAGFSSRRRHTRCGRDWSSDVCSSDLLPGVGEKTATRLAFFLLGAPESYTSELGQAIVRLRSDIRLCEECFNLTAQS